MAHLTSVLIQYGYPFIFLILFAESLAIPAPSEFTLVTAGVLAGRGQLSLVGIVVAGALGSTCGAMLSYAIGKRGGRLLILKYGRYVGLNQDRLHAVETFFHRRGAWAVLIGRVISGVRAVISYPAGMFDMPFPRFLVATVIGAIFWPVLAAGAGTWIGEHWGYLLHFATHYWPWISLGLAAAGVAWWTLRRKGRLSKESDA